MDPKTAKILIVDDSVFMRNVLKNILQNEGYSDFIESSNGNEALEKIEKESPNLILMDLIMPEKGGMEVLEKVGKTAKIIVISAVGQDKIVENAKNLGAIGFIIKPFDNAQVIEEVKKALI